MKRLLKFIALLTALNNLTLADGVPLEGKFASQIEKTLQWMIENKHPAIKQPGDEDRLREAMGAPKNPLIHQWTDGHLTAIVTKDFSETYKWDCKEVSATTFRCSKPADKSNTEMVRTITITSPDTYYLETTVNGIRTREYFRRTAP